MPFKIPKGFMRIQDAARVLGLTRQTIHEWVRDERIKSKKMGKARLIPISEVQRFQ